MPYFKSVRRERKKSIVFNTAAGVTSPISRLRINEEDTQAASAEMHDKQRKEDEQADE